MLRVSVIKGKIDDDNDVSTYNKMSTFHLDSCGWQVYVTSLKTFRPNNKSESFFLPFELVWKGPRGRDVHAHCRHDKHGLPPRKALHIAMQITSRENLSRGNLALKKLPPPRTLQ